MKSTFDLKHEIKLSASFLLDRITPALFYFISFFIVLNNSKSHDADTFSIYYSTFNTFLAIALGFTVSIKHFSAKDEAGNIILETLLLCLLISTLSACLYFFYIDIRVPPALTNRSIEWIFLLTIPLIAFFYFISSMNEGTLRVSSNNKSNAISLTVFLMLLFLLNSMIKNILYAVCYAFLITRLIMLLVLLITSNLKIALKKIRVLLIIQIVIYGAPMTLLFFIQKYIQTEGLLLVTNSGESAALYQMILTIALLFNLYANAISTNGFVNLSKTPSKANLKKYLIYTTSLSILALLLVVMLFEIGDGYFLEILIKERELLHSLQELRNVIYFLIFADMLFMMALFFARGMGDNWRTQSFWVVAVIVGCIVIRNNFTIDNILIVFSMASCVSSVFPFAYGHLRQGEISI